MTDNRFRTAPGGDPSDKRKNSIDIRTCFPGTFIPIGLSHIDIGNQAYARLKAYADHVGPTDDTYSMFRAKIHVDTWDDTVLYDGGCSWLDVSNHSSDFQIGTYSTGELFGEEKTIQVNFDKSFDQAPPQVIVWLRTIDISNSANARARAIATDITTTGFKLQVGTWHNETHIHDCKVSWIAIPTNRPNLTGGVAYSGQLKGGSNSLYTKEIKFDRSFNRAPHVAIALNKIDCSNQSNIRVTTRVENLTPQGAKLCIETWGDSVCYDIGVGYVVVGDY